MACRGLRSGTGPCRGYRVSSFAVHAPWRSSTPVASHLGSSGIGALLLVAASSASTGLVVGRTRSMAMKSRRATVLRATASQNQDNLALIFAKPHAYTPEVLKLVPEFLSERGIEVLREGSVAAAQIDEQGIIDAHYAAIAQVGMARDVGTLELGEAEAERFLSGYGKPLREAMAAGEVHSAVTAMEVLNVSASELLSRCLAAGYEKLRSGLYCACLESGGGADTPSKLYVLNGFYARMREKFTTPGVVVHWWAVQFDASKLPWGVFRKEVIGATNPSDAAAGSLRATIRDRWQELGLREATNYQDNGVHASAGPLEAMRERVIWLGDDPKADPFGVALASRGVTDVEALIDNPVIDLDGRSGSAFDVLEDVDTAEALDMLAKSTRRS